MIAWTTPAAKTLTGLTVFTASNFGSTSFSGEFPSTTVGFGSGFTSQSFTESRYSSFGIDGTTRYTMTSSAREVRADPGNVGGVTQTSGETISTTAATAFLRTSTTVTQEALVFSTSTIESESTAWTTSYNEEGSSVEFYSTETQTSETEVYIAGQTQFTSQATTALDQTHNYGEEATVVQADNGILYVLERPDNWNGYSVATELATSGTRFTISPSFSTQQASVVAASGVGGTASMENSIVSSSISWSATTLTQSTRTLAFPGFTGVAVTALPISTSENTNSGITTTGSTASYTVFAANTLTYNQTADVAVTTTSQVTSWGASRSKAPRRFGTLDFETTAVSAVSTTRAITTIVAASSSFSNSTESAANTGGEQRGATGVSENGITAQFNYNVFGTPQATTALTPGAFDRAKFITTGAAIGSNRGGWFTASDSFSLPVAHAGDGRRGVTIFPTEFPFVTAYSDSVTYTLSTGTTTTTSSAVVGLEGESLTTTQNPLQSFIEANARQGVASPLPNGMTVVDICLGAGAYKNVLNGETSSFLAGITSYSEGQSAELSYWQGVRAVAPPVLTLSRTPIVWEVPRNPDALAFLPEP